MVYLGLKLKKTEKWRFSDFRLKILWQCPILTHKVCILVMAGYETSKGNNLPVLN